VTVADLTAGWRGTGPAAGYADLRAAMDTVIALVRMYRMRWSLEEIALSLAEFRGPHEQNQDTDLAWAALTEETDNILRLAP
jgi:hypothetical protein